LHLCHERPAVPAYSERNAVFCGEHDTLLFKRAEGPNIEDEGGALTAFHLRALALEYCRQRRMADFNQKMAALVEDAAIRQASQRDADRIGVTISLFKKLYIDSVFAILSGSKIDVVTGYRV
jgi:hypothetical protein